MRTLYILWVGLYNGAAGVDNRLALPQMIKQTVII